MRVVFAAALIALVLTTTGQATAQRQEADSHHHFQTQGPAEASTRCKLAEVAAYDTRVHIKCELFQIYREGNGAEHRVQAYRNEVDERIVYYGVAAENSLADRIVALAVEATPDDEVTIFFRVDATENPAGCGPVDCRRLTGLILPIRH